MNYKKYIGIIGGSEIDSQLYNECIQIGERIAEFKVPVICGGKSGVMEAIAKGVKKKNGITIGILPFNKDEANDYIDFPIGTGLDISRNAIIVKNADIIIAIDGKYGTLSEMAFAMQWNKKIIAYKSDFAEKLNIKNTNVIDEIIEFISKNL